MVKRKIIEINEDKCDGCGLCIPNCPEGALQIIDGKVRLISDLFCDGLGACIGHCPTDAIKVVEREAEPYNETEVMKNIVKHGENTVRAHLEHLKDHGEAAYLTEAIDFLRRNKIKVKKIDEKEFVEEESVKIEEKKESPSACGCPSSAVRDIKKEKKKTKSKAVSQESALEQWPVQLSLLPTQAPFFKNSDLLVCADCVPFADPNFHSELLAGKSLVIGCPKLDDVGEYEEKLTEIFKLNDLTSVTVAIMEVPCCGGLSAAVENAIEKSGKKIELITKVVEISR